MRPVALTALAISLATACGCGPKQGPSPRMADTPVVAGPVNAVAVSDQEFAERAEQVLAKRVTSQKERDLLAGVVRRQLERAERRFAAGKEEAGLAAIEGAMMLVRPSTYHPELFQGAIPALQSGAAMVSQRGNEGRALALYTILEELLPPGGARDDVTRHLEELDKWTTAMRQAGPMQDRGVSQRTAVDRALFEVSPQRVDEAREATVAWITEAFDFDASSLNIGSSPVEREEAVQAYRAIKAGGVSLVALYLRCGDAEGALAAAGQRNVESVMARPLVDTLKEAARGELEAWGELNAFYSEVAGDQQREISIDSELARAATWGTAVELYRLAPDDPRAVGPLAEALISRGMVEVAPLVLAGAFDENTDSYPLSAALSLVLRGVLTEAELGQHAAARRTYEVAEPLLNLASRKAVRSQVRPSAAQIHYVMGALEAQQGNIERAKTALEAALELEPNDLDTLFLLALVERHRGDSGRALKLLSQAGNIASNQQNNASVAQASLAMYEVHRDQGSSQKGERALRTALERTLLARANARTSREAARAERLLARALEHYGELDAARRATTRALEAARSDADELSSTLLDAARRALTLGDLRLGRVTAREALEEDIPPEDLVYIALWLQLLERRSSERPDGTALEMLTSLNQSDGWVATLAAWGLGRIDDAQLEGAASNESQESEAAFYVAMRKHSSPSATKGLEAVAKSRAIELVEVTIARDLLAASTKPKLPDGAQVP